MAKHEGDLTRSRVNTYDHLPHYVLRIDLYRTRSVSPGQRHSLASQNHPTKSHIFAAANRVFHRVSARFGEAMVIICSPIV